MSHRYTCLSCLLQQSRQNTPRIKKGALPPTWQVHNETTGAGYSGGARVRQSGRRLLSITTRRDGVHPTAFADNGEPSNGSRFRSRKASRFLSSAATDGTHFKVSPSIEGQIQALQHLKGRLNYFVYTSKDAVELGRDEMSIEQALGNYGGPPPEVEEEGLQNHYDQLTAAMTQHFAGQPYSEIRDRLEQIPQFKSLPDKTRQQLLQDVPNLQDSLQSLGIIQLSTAIRRVSSKTKDGPCPMDSAHTDPPTRSSAASAAEDEADVPATSYSALPSVHQDLVAVDMGKIDVPTLSFDLSRVLFNPGVYQLQDPRSRVYNFDPYLEKIMPVTEFNFEALNKYVTSSKDNSLRDIAVQRKKRYIGSSSSMTSTLAHLHFLLSGWRPLTVDMLSREFKAESDNFTKFQRAPTAAFLRYQDGVYAMDADKEFDDATVLLSLGRSMEKLLTLEKEDYEKLRKSNALQSGDFELPPEQYHYTELGSFLMRSQLDAYDPRLPGTGMFDLKTRAVVSIRMTMADERGKGYQIKHRYGTWESFEREYYDMMRSAFLKYSLQARMGRMDGIFVAYHNIERIFGFQYISLPEMDKALHGQTNRSLGDQEFQYSIKLLTELFDRATKQFPEQSIRFHFETRESAATKKEAKPWMYVFAEPVSEEEVERIQSSRVKEVREAEQRILGGATSSTTDSPQTLPAAPEFVPESNAADSTFLDSLAEIDVSSAPKHVQASKPDRAQILGLKVVVQNKVDGHKTMRPVKLTADQKWSIDYSITEMPQHQAQAKYIQCRSRRSIIHGSNRDNNRVSEGYVSRLIDMSEAGAAWRKRRDELDAAREKVVLYDD